MTDLATIWTDPLAKYYLSAVVGLYPAARICGRAGLHPAVAFLLLLPYFGLPALSVYLACKRWPKAGA